MLEPYVIKNLKFFRSAKVCTHFNSYIELYCSLNIYYFKLTTRCLSQRNNKVNCQLTMIFSHNTECQYLDLVSILMF